jgi:predicted kinase
VTPTLVVIRGNSGSGKTTTAREVRRRFGRGAALVEQDYLRRVVLREHGGNPVAPAFIMGTVRAALDAGYHVVLEGILHSGQHGRLLRDLMVERAGFAFWFDVTFTETVRRHQARPSPIPVSVDQMRSWFTPQDLLGVPGEQIIPQSATLDEAVTTILHTTGLDTAAALTPCPTTCPRCSTKHL